MPGLLALIAVLALLLTVLHAASPARCPLWVPVFLAAFVLAVLTWTRG